jgi:hypothetical protein
MKTGSRRLGGFFIAGLATIASLALSAGPVAAQTQLSHVGKTGAYQLNESDGNESVVCTYDNDSDMLDYIDVTTPTIWARNSNVLHGGPGQRVGWQILIQKQTANGWKTIVKTKIKKAKAWYDVSAFFETRHLDRAWPVGATLRLVDKIFWYKPSGAVAGYVSVRYDFYREVLPGTVPEENPVNYCYSQFLH